MNKIMYQIINIQIIIKNVINKYKGDNLIKMVQLNKIMMLDNNGKQMNQMKNI